MTTIIDGSGSATFATPLPITQGGTNVGVLPAFDAYLSADQVVTSGTSTKIQLNIKVFDITNAFDAVTNYRFQPTVAGYYQLNCRFRGGGSTGTTVSVMEINKNGALLQRVTENNILSSNTGSALIFMNGTTDYLEFFATVVGTGTITFASAGSSAGIYGPRVSAFLARAA